MKSFEIYTKARQALTLSQNMLDMAHQSNWLLFEKTEQQRQKLLTEIFEHDDIHDMLFKITHFLQQILDIDNESIQLGQQARKETLHQLSTIRSNVTAVGKYQQFSAFESNN
ncbi:hypothetical protein MNBD_GAMMA22-2143 [hydrothermal vent metagenome]|uniref:Flagellar protein FliT n=1 Tax=hydrothermal vent metagenome TaxID=652676 RepID=A0A3B1AN28_9ZZZZ